MNVVDLPFNQYLGLNRSESDSGISLTPQPHHLNHADTLHATVLFGLAEAASGQALLKRFPELPNGHLAVLRASSVKYRQPGIAGQVCVASGAIENDKAEEFCQQLDSRRRAMLEVVVKVEQERASLLTGTFTWFATQVETTMT